MSKIGNIKNATIGGEKAGLLSLYLNKDVYTLQTNYTFKEDKKYNLSTHMASFQAQNSTVSSKKGVVGRTALSGLAGLAWSKDNKVMTGILGGAASSVKTTRDTFFIKIKLINGVKIYGETSHKVASTLESISPQISDKKAKEIIESQQRHLRYLEDAPRTYVEISKEIIPLEKKVAKLEKLKDGADTFDNRENARVEYETLKDTLDRKLTLQEELRVRALAIENSSNTTVATNLVVNMPRPNTRLDYAIKLAKIQKQIKYNKVGFVTFIISIVAMMVFSKDDGVTALSAIYFVSFIGYSLFYLVMLIPRKMNITKCQKKVLEYTVDDVELSG